MCQTNSAALYSSKTMDFSHLFHAISLFHIRWSLFWLACSTIIGTLALVQHCSSAISKIEIPIEIFYSDLSGNCFFYLKFTRIQKRSTLRFSFPPFTSVARYFFMVHGVLPFGVHRFGVKK